MARPEVTGRKPTQTADRPKRRPGPPSAIEQAVEATPHDEPAMNGEGKTLSSPDLEPTPHKEPHSTADIKTQPIRGPPKYRRNPKRVDPDMLAMSISAFCVLHGISEDQFYKMKREGWGPATMHVGRRTLISHEAAAQWRREREAAAKETVETAS